jgi:RNA polymerase sigma-70 factor (ECF subfamily)
MAPWKEFLRRFNPVIARSVIRVAMRHGISDKSLIDDLVQETYVKICANECKLIRTFTPLQPDSAFGFLKVVAASVAHDFFKGRLADKRAPEATAASVEEKSPAARVESTKGTLNAAERAVLIEQIDRKLSAVVSPVELQRARTVFWLYYRSGFTASAIASLPALDLTTKGVESMLFRLTRLVRERVSSVAGADSGNKKGFQQA